MQRHYTRTAVAATALFLTGVLPGVAGAACDRPARPVDLKFKVGADECVLRVLGHADDADADSIRACPGDTIRWKVNGRGKTVVFEGASPFDWIDSGVQQNRIEGIVRGDAAKNGQATVYKYSIRVDGLACVLDPTIIIDH